jgi:hypothetical protein
MLQECRRRGGGFLNPLISEAFLCELMAGNLGLQHQDAWTLKQSCGRTHRITDCSNIINISGQICAVARGVSVYGHMLQAKEKIPLRGNSPGPKIPTDFRQCSSIFKKHGRCKAGIEELTTATN